MNSNQVSFSMNHALRAAIAAAIAVAGVNAIAAEQPLTSASQAIVANACSITTTAVDFGAYDSVLQSRKERNRHGHPYLHEGCGRVCEA